MKENKRLKFHEGRKGGGGGGEERGTEGRGKMEDEERMGAKVEKQGRGEIENKKTEKRRRTKEG